MNHHLFSSGVLGATLLVLQFAVGGAWAQSQAVGKPAAATTSSQKAPAAIVTPISGYFSEEQRKAIQDYYASQRKRTGRCPPGLAKKNNGCLPPGQAKKWAMGQALPADVRYESLPEEILRRIGLPPKEMEIVRILNDILVLQKGSRLVLDAVEILSQP